MLPMVNVVECKEAKYLLFNTVDSISICLYRTGQWEENLLFISRFLIENVSAPLVLDVGANLGAFSIPLAKGIQSKGGEVYAFEPQKIVYYQLCGNVVLNRLENYTAINSAVGQTNSTIEIPQTRFHDQNNIGGFSILQEYRTATNLERFVDYEKMMRVPMITLDSLQLPRAASLIKIDVEGYELNVLKGAVHFLQQHDYPPLMFEAWSADWFLEKRRELLSFIEELGYEISLKLKDDYIAQHRKHTSRVDFRTNGAGGIQMVRVE